MTDSMHKFKIGQTVDLITSTARSAASGRYQIISLRPTDGGGDPQYRVKSKSEVPRARGFGKRPGLFGESEFR